jgi:hypothetical protein
LAKEHAYSLLLKEHTHTYIYICYTYAKNRCTLSIDPTGLARSHQPVQPDHTRHVQSRHYLNPHPHPRLGFPNRATRISSPSRFYPPPSSVDARTSAVAARSLHHHQHRQDPTFTIDMTLPPPPPPGILPWCTTKIPSARCNRRH